MPDTTTDFAFVNESGASAAYKPGHRENVHSHVRKHVAKQFKQKHKIGRKAEAADNPLASGHSGYNDESQAVSLDDYCLPTLFGIASNTNSLGYPTSTSNKLAALVPKDSAAIEIPASTSALPPGTVDDNPPVISPSDQQVHFGPHYRGPRRMLISSDRRFHPGDGRCSATVPKLKESIAPSPLQFLGAGRVDPFSSYPIRKPDRALHELVDLCEFDNSPGPLSLLTCVLTNVSCRRHLFVTWACS